MDQGEMELTIQSEYQLFLMCFFENCVKKIAQNYQISFGSTSGFYKRKYFCVKM